MNIEDPRAHATKVFDYLPLDYGFFGHYKTTDRELAGWHRMRDSLALVIPT